MSFFSELEDLTREAIGLFGLDDAGAQLQLVWNGVTIDCMEEDSEVVDALKAGGVVGETDSVIRAIRADFTGGGAKSIDFVSIGDQSYKVKAVMGSRGDPECRLVLIGRGQRK
jgi:hypothetical protein